MMRDAIATGLRTAGSFISQWGVQDSTEQMYATHAERPAAVRCAEM